MVISTPTALTVPPEPQCVRSYQHHIWKPGNPKHQQIRIWEMRSPRGSRAWSLPNQVAAQTRVPRGLFWATALSRSVLPWLYWLKPQKFLSRIALSPTFKAGPFSHTEPTKNRPLEAPGTAGPHARSTAQCRCRSSDSRR